MKNYSKLFQLAGWAIAVLSTVLGIYFVAEQEAVAWDPQPGASGTFTSRVVDLEPVGLALLGTGILSLVALCITESLRKR